MGVLTLLLWVAAVVCLAVAAFTWPRGAGHPHVRDWGWLGLFCYALGQLLPTLVV